MRLLTQLVTTSELLDLVKVANGDTIEAEIHHAGLRCTHWFHYYDSRIYHEGIDSVTVRLSRKAILESYPQTYWRIV